MSNPIALIEKKNEALVDSRLMAEQLGITHEAVLKTIDTYIDVFHELQPLRFEIAVAKRKHGGGTPIRHVLLSEDQSFLLLTFSRNTKRVVALKLSLIQAFGRFRREQQNATDYLPFYHELHDAIKALAAYARQNGSSSEERVFHMTYNKLINKYCGIEAGDRQCISVSSRVNVNNATAAIIATINRGIELDTEYHEIYKQAKVHVISVTQIKRHYDAQPNLAISPAYASN
ncbi:Rha family transcriptional regulator [Methylomonas sp. MO1]|uniref:Rha family transcriptional regulator n=1 Tax=Methylomonas sp. MO1 TaxID=3073619 RepID=UPI0028A4B352|nr:Rha family transcriptional regulator [Methylomonas sp. MO1]MDT4292185.1 Rha family transcriptional regulator [Methylomonas sp. MO1]